MCVKNIIKKDSLKNINVIKQLFSVTKVVITNNKQIPSKKIT